jgi:hypothetical protein
MMRVPVDVDLLHAFAALNDGARFTRPELECRIVQAETDEGHPGRGQVLQVIAVPADPSWHAHMQQYGPGPHFVTLYQDVWEPQPGPLGPQVEQVLRQKLLVERRQHEARGRAMDGLLAPLGLGTTRESIIERLKKVFGWIEERDMRVGELWLHPKQVAELEAANDPGWDKVASRVVQQMVAETKGGALYVALLWGASVYQSEMVIEDHVAALPDGWNAKLIDSSACMPF